MSRRIYQVKFIFFAVLSRIIELNGMRLDRYSALSLKIHVIQYLLLHIPLFNGLRQF